MSESQMIDVYGTTEMPKGDVSDYIKELLCVKGNETKACAAAFKTLRWPNDTKQLGRYGVHIVATEKQVLFEATNDIAWVGVSVTRSTGSACGEAWISGEEMEKFISSKLLYTPVIVPTVSGWPDIWVFVKYLAQPAPVKPGVCLSSDMLEIPSRIDAALGGKKTGCSATFWEIVQGATELDPVWVTARLRDMFRMFCLLMPLHKD